MTFRKITASTNDVFGGRLVRIHGVRLVGGTTAGTARLDNVAVAGSDDYITLKVAIDGIDSQDFGKEGLTVDYVSAVLSGTGTILYLFYS